MHPYSCASFLPEAKASDVAAVLSTPRVAAPAAPATAMISDAFPRIRVGLSFKRETMVCMPKSEPRFHAMFAEPEDKLVYGRSLTFDMNVSLYTWLRLSLH